MGSCSMENSSQDDTASDLQCKDLRMQRPECSICEDCGRKFTLRAMEIHKRSCLESEDCPCKVCRELPISKDWIQKKKNKSISSTNLGSKSPSTKLKNDLNVKPRSRDFPSGKGTNTKNDCANNAENRGITFTVLDKNCSALDKTVAETRFRNICDNLPTMLSGDISPSDYQHISLPSESPGDSTSIKNISENSSNIHSLSGNHVRCESHDEESCNRKVFCVLCNNHISWESFGLHALGHSDVAEDNSLKCPKCRECFSEAYIILLHFHKYMKVHPSYCTDCECDTPKCVIQTSCTNIEHCCTKSGTFFCYICHNYISDNSAMINHMKLHSKPMSEYKRLIHEISNLQHPINTYNPATTSGKNIGENSSNVHSPSGNHVRCENHDEESCNRKVFCFACKNHISWETFGLHVLEHCVIVKDNYLKCPTCTRCFSKPVYILLHFFTYMHVHPLDCSDCQCDSPKCVVETSCRNLELCRIKNGSFFCYICHNYFNGGLALMNHMKLHSEPRAECKRSIHEISNLQRNITIYQGNRHDKYTDCYRFATATPRNHLGIDTRETPFVSNISPCRFMQISNLKNHMAEHMQKDMLSITASSAVEMASEENNSMSVPDTDVLNESLENGINVDAVCDTKSYGTSCPNLTNIGSSSNVNAIRGMKKFTPYNIKKNEQKSGKVKVYLCNICTRTCTSQYNLAVHMKSHRRGKLYYCESCDSEFAQREELSVHLHCCMISKNYSSSSEEKENILM